MTATSIETDLNKPWSVWCDHLFPAVLTLKNKWFTTFVTYNGQIYMLNLPRMLWEWMRWEWTNLFTPVTPRAKFEPSKRSERLKSFYSSGYYWCRGSRLWCAFFEWKVRCFLPVSTSPLSGACVPKRDLNYKGLILKHSFFFVCFMILASKRTRYKQGFSLSFM